MKIVIETTFGNTIYADSLDVTNNGILVWDLSSNTHTFISADEIKSIKLTKL